MEQEDEEVKELKRAMPEMGFHILDINGVIPLEEYGQKRKCRKCGAKLSKYNPADECWPCQEKLRKMIFGI